MEAEGINVVMWPESPGRPWRVFRDAVRVCRADRPEDVVPALKAISGAVDEGLYAAGFLAYESARGLDTAFQTHPIESFPLVWFGLFSRVEETVPVPAPSGVATGPWRPSLSRAEYTEAIGRIKSYLRAGDTYQVNYTFRLYAALRGEPWALFMRMAKAQRARYCAFIETEPFAVCSASPELFFRLDGTRLLSRPMKGTSKRGLTFEEDAALAEGLARSEKNRAENVMIVDMVRNDMGRVAEPGSVAVERLFDVERYPTVLQMTSTVAARTSASFESIVKALFPCASITGAPKVRTMQIIRELEGTPRGIYTGAIGCLLPGRKAEFNVAIRTLVLDKRSGQTEYGVGGGIVWDSDAQSEYEECRTKAAVLTPPAPPFELLETILWDGRGGYFLMERHLARLERSAAYFGFIVELDALREALSRLTFPDPAARYRVRLLAAEDGRFSIDPQPLAVSREGDRWVVTLAAQPVDSGNRFLYHKTTNRAVYEAARQSAAGYDDVLLRNERDEITEGTIANIVVETADGRRLTPPVRCGLLPGIFREWLLERGEVEEAVVRVADIRNAREVFLVNSVRKWVPVTVDLSAIRTGTPGSSRSI